MKFAHYLLLLTLSVLLLLTACEQKPLLAEVTFIPSTISPNADGRDDLTNISFRLNRNATVAIHFYDAEGKQYTFRSPTPLSLNEEPYSVLFPGVVEGFTTEAEEFPYQVLKRVLPDGHYQWEISAETTTGERAVVTGD